MTICSKISENCTWLSWSSGKDSAYSLFQLSKSPEYNVTTLLTTVTNSFDRISMHGTRRQLLELQAKSIDLPLKIVSIPFPCSNAIYEKIMGEVICEAEGLGVQYFAFGDLHLEDVKAYREKMLKNSSLKPLFPIWKKISTGELAKKIIQLGFKAYVVCVDPKVLPSSFAGRVFDESFLQDLPDEVDPCGENGEFHTFVFDGPLFKQKISCELGKIVERDGFIFADVVV